MKHIFQNESCSTFSPQLYLIYHKSSPSKWLTNDSNHFAIKSNNRRRRGRVASKGQPFQEQSAQCPPNSWFFAQTVVIVAAGRLMIKNPSQKSHIRSLGTYHTARTRRESFSAGTIAVEKQNSNQAKRLTCHAINHSSWSFPSALVSRMSGLRRPRSGGPIAVWRPRRARNCLCDLQDFPESSKKITNEQIQPSFGVYYL